MDPIQRDESQSTSLVFDQPVDKLARHVVIVDHDIEQGSFSGILGHGTVGLRYLNQVSHRAVNTWNGTVFLISP